MTIADGIRLVITNMPVILFIAALVVASLRGATAERYLAWQLLLPIGVQGLWAGLYHVLAPTTAAAFIGWQVSPFQFEVGMADIALGIVATVAFWRPFEFKAATVLFTIVYFGGLVFGHVHQIVSTHNYAAGNAGLLLALTVIEPVLLAVLLYASWRTRAAGGNVGALSTVNKHRAVAAA